MNILSKIVAVKKQEITQLYEQHELSVLRAKCEATRATLEHSTPSFYQALAKAHSTRQPFFITEFKRKSPSEGWINEHADLPAQIRAYAEAGASAISVLSDPTFFGGSYADLALAADTLQGLLPTQRPLLLQKDFILDPIQIYLARLHGADLILLIAAILDAEQLDDLKNTAESLGMGVLVEVHDQEELDKIQHLNFPVLGVNNRDLKTFRTALNRVNVLRNQLPTDRQRFVISESGVRDAIDFQMVGKADGFLIGTGLMRRSDVLQVSSPETFPEYFQSQGKSLFKACGVRREETLQSPAPDFIGINFSALSKRRPDALFLEQLQQTPVFPPHWVAVFYKNTESEIQAILSRYPFQTIQLYAGDVSPAFVRSLRQRVLLAVSIRSTEDLAQVSLYAADVDCFILDGAAPGSGQSIETGIPSDFPYPFLLAGGIHADNLDRMLRYDNCIGVDVASGIEHNGLDDLERMEEIALKMKNRK